MSGIFIHEGIKRRLRSVGKILSLPGRLPRWWKSRSVQHKEIKLIEGGAFNKLVIFFIPENRGVTGGTLQIFSLYRMTKDFLKGTGGDALICWLPDEGWDIHKFEGFENDVIIFPLEMVLNACHPGCEIMFHVPEYAAERFCESVGWGRLKLLRERRLLKINILNQNIEVMPGRNFIDRLKVVFPDLCCTVGNPAWETDEEKCRLNIPIHTIPTWYYPDDAPRQPYESKKDILIVSPDLNSYRELVLDAIRRSLPDLDIRVVYGLKYERYLELERTAKWSLTFGEGLDGYFYGPVLRGGVAFAVRNGTFNLPGLEDLRTVYPSYEMMAEKIVEDICTLDTKDAYERYNAIVRNPLVCVLGRDRTSRALEKFYRDRWSLTVIG